MTTSEQTETLQTMTAAIAVLYMIDRPAEARQVSAILERIFPRPDSE